MAQPNSLKAVVRGGRITLDEPTDLPDGQIIELVPADPYAHLDDTGAIDPNDKAELDSAITSAWKSYKTNDDTVAAEDVIAELRAKA